MSPKQFGARSNSSVCIYYLINIQHFEDGNPNYLNTNNLALNFLANPGAVYGQHNMAHFSQLMNVYKIFVYDYMLYMKTILAWTPVRENQSAILVSNMINHVTFGTMRLDFMVNIVNLYVWDSWKYIFKHSS